MPIGRLIVLSVFLPALLLCCVIPVFAHANLVASIPAAGSVVPLSPEEVVLDFSEPADPVAFSVELRDSNLNLIVGGPGTVDPALPTRLRLAVPPLPDGIYNAIWQVRSSVDGHITSGTVSFSVGANTLPPSLLPPPGTPEPATERPAPMDALARWLSFVAAAMAVGSPFFGILVWRPAFRRLQPQPEETDARLAQLLINLVLAGSAVWVLATLFLIGVQANQLDNVSLVRGLLIIFGGRSGFLTVVRVALLLVMVLITFRLPSAGSGRSVLWVLCAAAGAGALLTISLQSHSSALPGDRATLATALDWLHLLAMAVWLGGLLPLLWLLWPGRLSAGAAPVLIPSFSRVAVPCVTVLALTGLYSMLVHVRTLDALFGTTPGRALVLKLALFMVLLALGAANLVLISPLLRRDEVQATGRLRRTVPAELLIGAFVLLLAGIMTAVGPAYEALEAQNRLGFRGSAAVEDVEMTLRIAPFKLGDNEFAVDIKDDRPGAEAVEPAVLLRLSNENLGVEQVELLPAGGGRFLARGSFLTLAGDWQIEVIVRRAGFDDARHVFPLTIE